MEPTNKQAECTHHFVIEPARVADPGESGQQDLGGICKKCGLDRMFSNTVAVDFNPSLAWRQRKKGGQPAERSVA